MWTAKVSLVLLPELSTAVQVTVVWPMWKVDPEAGSQLTAIDPSAISVAVTM